MARFRPLFASILLLALGCSAQSGKISDNSSSSLNRRIEQKVRSVFRLPQEIRVSAGPRGPSEIPGYDKIPVTLSSNGRSSTHDFLISRDDKTIIEWEKLDISQDVMDTMALDGRPQRGNKDAKVTIVNYDDFECPFCSRMHQTLFPELMKVYGSQVKVIYKDYPLVEIHPWAMHAAVDANCLAAENSDAYWEFADYAHAHQKEITGERRDIKEESQRLDQLTADIGKKHNVNASHLEACLKKQDETAVRVSLAEGKKLGIDATPTIFVNGERLSGAVPDSTLREILDRALKDAGQTPPVPTVSATPKSGAQ